MLIRVVCICSCGNVHASACAHVYECMWLPEVDAVGVFFFFEGFPLNLELIYLPVLTDQGQGSTCLRLHRTIKAVPHLAWVFMWVLEPQSQVLMLFASQAL